MLGRHWSNRCVLIMICEVSILLQVKLELASRIVKLHVRVDKVI